MLYSLSIFLIFSITISGLGRLWISISMHATSSCGLVLSTGITTFSFKFYRISVLTLVLWLVSVICLKEVAVFHHTYTCFVWCLCLQDGALLAHRFASNYKLCSVSSALFCCSWQRYAVSAPISTRKVGYAWVWGHLFSFMSTAVLSSRE
jgi:hypothetical protein